MEKNGHPILNMIIIMCVIIITIVNSIVGIKTLYNSIDESARNVLKIAVALSCISVIFAILGMLIIRHNYNNMNKPFAGFKGVAILSTLVICNCLALVYYVAASKLDTSGSITNLTRMSIISLLLLIVSSITTIVAEFQKQIIIAPIQTNIQQEPPYTNLDGARQQLNNLHVASASNPGPTIQIGAVKPATSVQTASTVGVGLI